ncbi:MAG TPA: helix-turn-helix transcriptional regulator [Trebonia sp.]|nr:helix-turn-helix transcriptional regulator [Trebonia sp.]
MNNPYDMTDDTPVYVISVAAQLSGLHPQTLRTYDRIGLVSPGRSTGRGRRYSMRDVLALREVQRLSQNEGVNLSGIKRILELNDDLDRSRRIIAELRSELAQLRVELESTRSVAARLADLLRRGRGGPGVVVPVRSTARVAVWEPADDTGTAAVGPEDGAAQPRAADRYTTEENES